jgi:hypothetical protein
MQYFHCPHSHGKEYEDILDWVENNSLSLMRRTVETLVRVAQSSKDYYFKQI